MVSQGMEKLAVEGRDGTKKECASSLPSSLKKAYRRHEL